MTAPDREREVCGESSTCTPGVKFADDGDVILIQVDREHGPLDLRYVERLDGEARSLGPRGAVLGND